MTYPVNFLTNIFAVNGDKDAIPDIQLQTGSGQVSWQKGFPIESEKSISEGGKPPKRKEFNGVLNSLSQHIYWLQAGGIYKHDQNRYYEQPAWCAYENEPWLCKKPNMGQTPKDGSEYWERIITESRLRQFLLDRVYPIGAIYISTTNTNPGVLFGGTWLAIPAGRVLLAQGTGYAAGTTGGNEVHTITTNELPSHSHSVSISNNGSHNHELGKAGTHSHSTFESGSHAHTVNSAGSHSHTRGTMEIYGEFNAPESGGNYASGAFTVSDTRNRRGTSKGDWDNSTFYFSASRNWTGSTSENGNHNHTITSGGTHSHTTNQSGEHAHSVISNGSHTHNVTVGNTGDGQSFSVMQPYLSVYMWKRTA